MRSQYLFFPYRDLMNQLNMSHFFEKNLFETGGGKEWEGEREEEKYKEVEEEKSVEK